MSDAVLSVVLWSAYSVQLIFWLTCGWMLSFKQAGLRPSDRIRAAFRLSRRWLWPSFGLYCLMALAKIDKPSGVPITVALLMLIGWLNWRDWKRSKGLDDDDWTKRLVEWGQGVVERVGNKLAVVVPAPAGA